jgi:hypothetical protein
MKEYGKDMSKLHTAAHQHLALCYNIIPRAVQQDPGLPRQPCQHVRDQHQQPALQYTPGQHSPPSGTPGGRQTDTPRLPHHHHLLTGSTRRPVGRVKQLLSTAGGV